MWQMRAGKNLASDLRDSKKVSLLWPCDADNITLCLPRPFPINYPFFSRVSLITAHEIFKLFSSQEAQMCWIPTLYQSVPKVAGRQGESLSQPPQTIFRTGQIISVHFRKEPFLIRRNDARHLYKYSVKKIWLVSDDMLVILWGQNMMLQVIVKAYCSGKAKEPSHLNRWDMSLCAQDSALYFIHSLNTSDGLIM